MGKGRSTIKELQTLVKRAKSREEFWAAFLQAVDARVMVEVGVYKGDFAAEMLRKVDGIEKYYLLDPWRHLPDWNKPANEKDAVFEECYREAMDKTAFAAEKRVVLRGKTTEVIQQIPEGSLDFAYIDGDHTLKGITIDLVRVYSGVHEGGWIGGDDFCNSIWQHSTAFEPTLVFPFVLYFAEAVSVPLFALPWNQFLLHKNPAAGFSFTDFTGNYKDSGLRAQCSRGLVKGALREGVGKMLRTR